MVIKMNCYGQSCNKTAEELGVGSIYIHIFVFVRVIIHVIIMIIIYVVCYLYMCINMF